MEACKGAEYMGDEITRKEFDLLCVRVNTLERTTAVTDNEITHIRADIAWIKRGVMWIFALLGTTVIGALLKLVLKV
jgi:hypothetical protein